VKNQPLPLVHRHSFMQELRGSSCYFGFHLAVLGYLIFKSGYFPRILGVLMVFAALGYLTHSYGSWLYPNYAETLAWLLA
jgi:hypothetical protein